MTKFRHLAEIRWFGIKILDPHKCSKSVEKYLGFGGVFVATGRLRPPSRPCSEHVSRRGGSATRCPDVCLGSMCAKHFVHTRTFSGTNNKSIWEHRNKVVSNVDGGGGSSSSSGNSSSSNSVITTKHSHTLILFEMLYSCEQRTQQTVAPSDRE